MSQALRDRILERLRDPRPEGPLEELCRLGIERALERPLLEWMNRERLLALALPAIGGPALELTLARHVRPALERAMSRASERGERVGEWLPEQAVTTLETLLSEPVVLDAEEVRKGVHGEAIRRMLTTVVQEALSRFMRSGEGAGGGGGGGGIVGLFGKGAGMLRDAGKGILGGFGDELERQIQRRIKDVLDASMVPLQERLVEWILSAETARSLGRARANMFRGFLKRRTAEARELPVERLMALVPEIVRHNLERPEIRDALAAEIDALLGLEGARPVRELLAEAGVEGAVRQELLERSLEQARGLLDDERFASWLLVLVQEP